MLQPTGPYLIMHDLPLSSGSIRGLADHLGPALVDIKKNFLNQLYCVTHLLRCPRKN